MHVLQNLITSLACTRVTMITYKPCVYTCHYDCIQALRVHVSLWLHIRKPFYRNKASLLIFKLLAMSLPRTLHLVQHVIARFLQGVNRKSNILWKALQSFIYVVCTVENSRKNYCLGSINLSEGGSLAFSQKECLSLMEINLLTISEGGKEWLGIL